MNYSKGRVEGTILKGELTNNTRDTNTKGGGEIQREELRYGTKTNTTTRPKTRSKHEQKHKEMKKKARLRTEPPRQKIIINQEREPANLGHQRKVGTRNTGGWRTGTRTAGRRHHWN